MASSKVGHFIYGLRDRVWPDFVCHFTLFRGVHPAQFGFHHNMGSSWSTNDQILEVAQRSPTRWNPNLDFLKNCAALDTSNRSRSELAKFGFISNDQISCGPSNVNIRTSLGNSKAQGGSENHHIQFGSLDSNILNSSLGNAKRENSDHSNSVRIIFGSFSEPAKLDTPLQKTFFNDNFFLEDVC